MSLFYGEAKLSLKQVSKYEQFQIKVANPEGVSVRMGKVQGRINCRSGYWNALFFGNDSIIVFVVAFALHEILIPDSTLSNLMQREKHSSMEHQILTTS